MVNTSQAPLPAKVQVDFAFTYVAREAGAALAIPPNVRNALTIANPANSIDLRIPAPPHSFASCRRKRPTHRLTDSSIERAFILKINAVPRRHQLSLEIPENLTT
jgi:hypothetical protein